MSAPAGSAFFVCTHFVHTFDFTFLPELGPERLNVRQEKTAMKNTNEGRQRDKFSAGDEAPEEQPNTCSYGWYQHRKSMDRHHWWTDEALFTALERKRDDSRRSSSNSKLTKNFDIPAAFFWETLRRHPSGRILRLKWSRLLQKDRPHLLTEKSLVRQLRGEIGPQSVMALDDFCAGWKLSYPRLLSSRRKPLGWLEGYYHLWRLVCKEAAKPLPTPWPFDGASARVLHGSPCVDLVVPSKPVIYDDLVRPFRGVFEEEATSNFGLTTFARPSGENGESLRELTPQEIASVLNSLCDSGDAPEALGTESHWEPSPGTLEKAAGYVSMLIDWRKAEQVLSPYGLTPMFLAVDLAAQTKLTASRFQDLLLKRREGRDRGTKKPNLSSFGKIAALDDALSVGRTIPSSIIREFRLSSGLAPERLVRILASRGRVDA